MESAASASDRAGPVFILGAVESGTALVRLHLDRHPRIAVAQETGFARALLAQQHIPFWLSGDQWWGRLGYSHEAFTAHLRDFYATMFRHFAAQHGKQRWAESTPLHVWHVDRLAEVFPDAVFVAVVRHPGGNVDALQRDAGYSLRRAMNHWLEISRELLALAEAHRERLVLCRYEDLVVRREATLRELLGWLGEPWSPAVLDDGRDPAPAGAVSQWTERLEPKTLQVLRNRAVGIGSIFGYDVHEPVPAAPMGDAAGASLMTGTEAARRLAQIRPAILELRVRPEPRLADRPLDPREVGLSAEEGRKARRKAKKLPKARSRDDAGEDRPGHSPDPPPPSTAERVVSRLPKPVRRRLRRAR